MWLPSGIFASPAKAYLFLEESKQSPRRPSGSATPQPGCYHFFIEWSKHNGPDGSLTIIFEQGMEARTLPPTAPSTFSIPRLQLPTHSDYRISPVGSQLSRRVAGGLCGTVRVWPACLKTIGLFFLHLEKKYRKCCASIFLKYPPKNIL